MTAEVAKYELDNLKSGRKERFWAGTASHSFEFRQRATRYMFRRESCSSWPQKKLRWTRFPRTSILSSDVEAVIVQWLRDFRDQHGTLRTP